jgi:CheY-like chemotaxis protein/DNA-directed RNA polymerase subunit M/transcription elongation factor TFIIS
MSQPLVFISYSHKDEEQKKQLVSHLKVVLPDLRQTWSDDRLPAGAAWKEEIDRALGHVKVAILLITADYLNSEFILAKEVPRLLERRDRDGLVLFPVIAKACAWKAVPWLEGLTARPQDGKPVWGDSGDHADEDLTAIAYEVAEILVKETPRPDAGAAFTAPASGGKRPAPAAGADKQAELPSVLLVEDDAGFSQSVKRILKGVAVCHEASSVADAINVLNSRKDIHVIVLDLQLTNGTDGIDEDGTQLLEYIKSRNLDYKVIVLTAHTELLGEDKAAYYNVFAYLSKAKHLYQPLRYEVEQAFKDVERAELAGKADDGDFDYVILNKYPTPFTYVYQKMRSYTPWLEKFKHQTDMVELLLNFSAVALICEYLSGGARTAELDAIIRDKISRPGLGEWSNIINEIIKRKGDLRQTAYSESFSAFYTSKNKKRIGDLISTRNKNLGHGATQSEEEYEIVAKECDDLLVPLLQDYKFITRFLVCQASSVEKTKKGTLYKLRECTGANPQLLFTQKTLGIDLIANEMYLINLDDEQNQSLHPFIILEYCKKCHQHEIFFYAKLLKDSLHYLSYKTNHRISRAEDMTDFLNLTGLTP